MSSTTAETSAVLPLAGQSGAPKLAVSERRIGDFRVDSVTSGRLQIEVKFALRGPQEKAFELVLKDLGSWFKEIGNISWNHERSDKGPNALGPKSTRVCEFGKDTLYEEIAFYDPPHAYAYRIDMVRSTAKFPLKDHLGVFIVERGSGGESLITWRQYFKKKFGPAAPMINFMLERQLMRKNLKTLIKQYGGRFL